MSESEEPEQPRLGGMALANGLLVHGPTHWAAAVRRSDGEVVVASGRKPRLVRGKLGDIPLVRGVLRLCEALAVVPVARNGTPGARLAMENVLVGASIVGAAALASVSRRRVRSVIGQESLGAIAGLLPALVALRASDAALWHGVEHKSIAAYEEGGAAEVANAASHPKEHERCGSNLVLPLMISTVLANTVARKTLGRLSVGARVGAAAASMGVAVEMFAFALRRPEHPVSRLVHGVGHTLQARFATREPGPEDMAVGRSAMEEIIRLEAPPAGDAVPAR